jgi:hypothetical protein
MRPPRVRLTVRRTMGTVASLGLVMAGLRWLLATYVLATYSSGYSESAFNLLRVGMTPRQVEAIMGGPIKRIELPEDDFESWTYADSPFSIGCERRRVLFKRGKVRAVIKEHWRGDFTILE